MILLPNVRMHHEHARVDHHRCHFKQRTDLTFPESTEDTAVPQLWQAPACRMLNHKLSVLLHVLMHVPNEMPAMLVHS